jgi:hypothetical protein
MVRRSNVVHNFLWVFKNIEFRLKTKKGLGSLWFYQKTSVRDKNKLKNGIFPREAHIQSRLVILVLYINFYGF